MYERIKKVLLNYGISNVLLFVVLIVRHFVLQDKYFDTGIELGFIVLTIYLLMPIILHKSNAQRDVYNPDSYLGYIIDYRCNYKK